MKPNLVKLYTINGPLFVDTKQLASGRTQLSIYTSRGNRLYDVLERNGRLSETPCTTVHKENLFASPELAQANYNAIVADMNKRAGLAA